MGQHEPDVQFSDRQCGLQFRLHSRRRRAINGFAPLNAAEQQAALSVLNDYAAISNLQFTQITESTTQHANLREAQSAQAGAAMTFAPNPLFNEYPLNADSWYDPGTTDYGLLVRVPS